MPTAVESRGYCVSMILEHVANARRTEEALYLRFQTLPRPHLAALKRTRREPDDWRLFRRIRRRGPSLYVQPPVEPDLLHVHG